MNEPLENKEVEELVKKSLKDITRTKLLYRLTMLKAEDLIKEKFVGQGEAFRDKYAKPKKK